MRTQGKAGTPLRKGEPVVYASMSRIDALEAVADAARLVAAWEVLKPADARYPRDINALRAALAKLEGTGQ